MFALIQTNAHLFRKWRSKQQYPRTKKWRQRHRAQARAIDNAWKKRNPSSVKASLKRWNVKNREHVRKYRKERWLRTKEIGVEQRRAEKKEYYRKNKDRIVARVMERQHRLYHSDPEWRASFLKRQSRHRKANPVQQRLKTQRYNARKNGADGSFTEQEWLDLCKKHDFKCAICGLPKPLEVDHIIPLSKGGTHFISNIQPACKSCNSGKRDKMPEEGYSHVRRS